MARVKTYERSHHIYDAKGNMKRVSEVFEFTQAQANEVGAVLEPDGINQGMALILVGKWNTRIIQTGYAYRINIKE